MLKQVDAGGDDDEESQRVKEVRVVFSVYTAVSLWCEHFFVREF